MTPLLPSAELEVPAPTRRKSSTSWRSIALYLARLAGAASIVYFLWFSGQLDLGVLAKMRFTVPGLLWLCASLLCISAGLWVASLRLNVLLRADAMRVALGRTFTFTSISAVVSAILPGLIGADAVRTAYLWNALPNKKPEALAVVAVDRALGLYAMLAAGSVALLWPSAKRWAPGEARAIFPLLALLGGAAIVLVGSRSLFRSRFARVIIERLPQTLRRLLETTHGVTARRPVMLAALGLALLNEMLLVSAYVAFDRLLGSGLSALAHYALDPVSMVMSAIPITPGGLGVVEAVSARLYEQAGARFGADMALSLRVLQYATSGAIAVVSLIAQRPGREPI